MTQVEEQRSGSPDRRAPTSERRRYNRRSSTGTELTPPYYEVFERIAVALEGISTAMSTSTTPQPARTARTPGPRSATPEGPARG
jgi:hypothetical protein